MAYLLFFHLALSSLSKNDKLRIVYKVNLGMELTITGSWHDHVTQLRTDHVGDFEDWIIRALLTIGPQV